MSTERSTLRTYDIAVVYGMISEVLLHVQSDAANAIQPRLRRIMNPAFAPVYSGLNRNRRPLPMLDAAVTGGCASPQRGVFCEGFLEIFSSGKFA